MSSRKLPTDSLITRAKREAKRLTNLETPYTRALDAQAVLAGYPDWRALARAHGERNAHEGGEFPLDPALLSTTAKNRSFLTVSSAFLRLDD